MGRGLTMRVLPLPPYRMVPHGLPRSSTASATTRHALREHRTPARSTGKIRLFWSRGTIGVAGQITSPPTCRGYLPCVFTNPPTRCPSDYRYGVRGPRLVVSAYTPPGYISNTPFDFGNPCGRLKGSTI